jgi:hypothetical protein
VTGLVEFLTARLDEDEAAAREEIESLRYGGRRGGKLTAARVLADVAAKRQIIELHTGAHTCREIHTGTYSADWPKEAPYGAPGQPWRHAQEEYFEDEPCPTLRLLALPYADHPDYDQAWRAE